MLFLNFPPFTRNAGGSGSPPVPPFNPSDLDPRQYALDATGYGVSTLNALPVLTSLETYDDYRVPRQGRCWLFDGVNDRAPLTSAISLSGAFTYTFWIRPTTNQVGAISGRLINSNASIVYNNISGNLTVETNTASSTAFATALSTAVFQHIAIVRTSGNSVTVYKNAVAVGTQTVTGVFEVGVFGCRNNVSPSLFLNGRLQDIRLYNVAKSLSEIQAIFEREQDTVGLEVQYPCNEEAGLVGYDISGASDHVALTNITEATFHATDTLITLNPNNVAGYRLSSGVYIPKRLTDANAANGNPLTVTGQAPYPVNPEPPCLTGNGTNLRADLGAVLIPASADYSIEVSYFHTTNDTTRRVIVSQDATIWRIQANALAIGSGTAGGLFAGDVTNNVTLAGALTANTWHRITLTKSGTTHTLTCQPFNGTLLSNSNTHAGVVGSSSNTFLLATSGSQEPADGRVSMFQLTTGGLTTYFPLQDGPGSSNTNRDLAFIRSDNTYGVVSSAITNGTVSTMWANRCPFSQDWSINYGGDLSANGAYLAGQIVGTLAADGSAKTFASNKFGNPYSRLNLNPFTAAELNGLGVETAYVKTTARQTVAPNNTKFRRTAADGDDRFVTFPAALTGTDLTDMETYVT